MASIFDYLTWRGDVPLHTDPFNEVDNLVLSELAYADFRSTVPQDGGEISIQEAARGFFARHAREAVLSEKGFTAKAPLLMEDMAAGARFGAVRLSHYVDESDPGRELQLSAVTFLLPDQSAYIAFRGTDGTLVGWKEDFNFSFLSETEGQRRAVQYLNRVGRAMKGPLLVGGHSKGGNLAVYAAAFCDREIQDRIQTVYSNDGPGFRQETVETAGYLRILPRIRRIIPDTSVIGMLLSSKAVPHVIKSSASGILQHDGFTWQVRRNRFEETALSGAGEVIGQALGGWLEQMDDETRSSFTQTVFSLFEATGMDTFSGMGGQKWKSAEAILTAAREMPREKQQEILRLLGQLGQSSGHAATAFLMNAAKKNAPETEET